MERTDTQAMLDLMGMKFIGFAVFAAVALAGCATPLKVENHGDDLARAIGVGRSEISFISYCSFGDAPPSGIHVVFNEGVIVLTRDSLVLLKGDPPKVSIDRTMRFAEIKGSDLKHFGRGRQLQVLARNNVTVIEISRNKAMIDPEGSERVRDALRQHGVPDWKSDKYYLMKPKTPIIIPIPIL